MYLALLWLLVLGFSVYAWRSCFIPLCMSVLLMAVYAHPDFPKTVAGIQGLNPWNFILLNIVLAWLIQRYRERHVWDLPRHILLLSCIYFIVILISSVRLIVDPTGLGDSGTMYFISEYLVNSAKFVLPGLLLYDTCRTRKRVIYALGAILGIYILLSVQVIRWMPISSVFSAGELNSRSGKIIRNEIGYHRVSMSVLLAGASWAILATVPLVQTPCRRLGLIGTAGIVIFAQALTAGRAGYVAWAGVGCIMSVLRWRRLLFLMPVLVLIGITLMPGVKERMLKGLGSRNRVLTTAQADDITSGRTQVWPFVIDKISASPLIGYGREAMMRTGLTAWLSAVFFGEEDFGHPHNAYLQSVLDNGFVGFVGIATFYGIVVWYALQLFLDHRDPLYGDDGGTALALVLSQLIAGLSGQTLYPIDDSVGMWASVGVMLRVSQARQRAQQTGGKPFSPWPKELVVAWLCHRFRQQAQTWQSSRTS